MAKPQLEDGYIRIALTVFDALARTTLSNSESRVLFAIIRKTWGWQKKGDLVPVSQISTLTGMPERIISKSVASLKARNIIIREVDGFTTFNKNFDSWDAPKGDVNTPVKIGSAKNGSAKIGTADLVYSPLPKSAPLPLSKSAGLPLPKSAPSIDKGIDNSINTIQKIGADGAKNAKKAVEEVAVSSPTPRQEAEAFFEDVNQQVTVSDWIVSKGASRDFADREIAKFISYWTEPTPDGKKQRWQREKAFEVRRRLATWLQRAVDRSPQKFNAEPKGIRI